jgi:hypothetical protein
VGLFEVVATVDPGIAGQRQPVGRRDALGFEPGRAVTLGREDEVERAGLKAAPVEIEMGVDGPPHRRMQFGGQVIFQPVINVEIEVEASARNGRQLVGLEMYDLDQRLERAAAITSRRLRPRPIIVDYRHATDIHGRLLNRQEHMRLTAKNAKSAKNMKNSITNAIAGRTVNLARGKQSSGRTHS